MLKSLVLSAICVSGVVACGSDNGMTANSSCPANAPLFTESLGTQLINQWGANALAYSPYGDLGYSDVYIGAVHFTGAQYLPNAVLLPTVSAIIRSGAQELDNYFTRFLAHGPIMTNNPVNGVDPSTPYNTLSACGVGVISGNYDFKFSDGSPDIRARYTFQFQYVAESKTMEITPSGGDQAGKSMSIVQSPGWYVQLQNSSDLPAS